MLKKTISTTDAKDVDNVSFGKLPPASKMRIHRSYPVGLSFARDIVG